MCEIRGMPREYLFLVTIRGYPSSNSRLASGISRSDWWFIRMRTPGQEGIVGRDRNLPPPTIRTDPIRTMARRRCHQDSTASRRAGNIFNNVLITTRWITSPTANMAPTVAMVRQPLSFIPPTLTAGRTVYQASWKSQAVSKRKERREPNKAKLRKCR